LERISRSNYWEEGYGIAGRRRGREAERQRGGEARSKK